MIKSWNINKKVLGYLFAFLLIVIFFVIICMQFKVYSVKGNSMNGAIEEGDYIIVNRISSKRIDYRRGDVVIVKKDNQIFVKRLLATEGDLLLIDDKKIETGSVLVPHDPVFNSFQINYNKEELACYKYVDLLNRNVSKSRSSLGSQVVIVGDSKCRVKIPQGYNFVVGDNFYESMDSRFWGFINNNEILGRVIAVF